MKQLDITSQRLHNQSLGVKRFTKPNDVVSWFGAVQAQDYAAAKWSLGLRIQNATDADIEAAFNDGTILRTHVMRPTWHFVMPEDIRWMLELTTPRVKTILAHYDRKLELTEKLLSRSSSIIKKALQGGKHLTRKELAEYLERSGVKAHGQRLGHIVSHAELDSLICSGPRRGKQFTYALLDERAPKFKPISRDEARATLALRYFTSHGPAQLKDFAWWSGLSVKDAAEGLDSMKSKLVEETLDGKTYWFSPHARAPKQKSPTAFLLSIYDEYIIAYKDRSALGGERYVEKLLSMGNALTAVLIHDGKIVDTWKRVIKKDTVIVTARPFRKLTIIEKEALESATRRYGEFLGMSSVLSVL